MPKKGQKKLKVKIQKDKKINKISNNTVLEKKTNEEIEKEKIMLMRVGVACFMMIFFVAWIFNLRYQFKMNSNNVNKSSFNWEQTRTELSKTLGQIKQGMAEIKQAQTVAQNTNPEEPELSNEQINLLKEKLINDVASSTIATSTTASSTISNNK
jgi:porphobilinogen deaminase